MTISVVQHSSDIGSNITSNTISATGAGNCLIALSSLVNGSDLDLTGVTAGGSADNWSALTFYNATTTADITVWIDPNCAGGSTAWQCTGAAGTTRLATDLFEISGLATSSVTDQISTPHEVDGTGASWTSSATGTTSQASEIAFGIVMGFNNTGSTPTITGPSSPWVNEPDISYTTGRFQVVGYNILSSTGTVTYSGTSNMTSPNNYYSSLVVTLKGAVAGPVAKPVVKLQAVTRAAVW